MYENLNNQTETSSTDGKQDVSKITAEVRDARAGQRHAELWLEKSLAEVDAVHAALAYERSVAGAGAHTTVMQQQTPFPVDHSMQTPQPNPRGRPPSPADHAMQTPQPTLHRHPPSPPYDDEGGHVDASASTSSRRTEVHEVAVGPTAQTPTPESPTAILASLGCGGRGGGGEIGGSVGGGTMDGHAAGAAAGVAAAASTLPSFPVSPTSPVRSRTNSGVRTPDLDVTRPELFSTTRLRSRVGRRGRGMGLAGDDGDDENGDDDLLEATVVRGEGGRGGDRDLLSPPTPTVLFGALAGDGESTKWGTVAARVAHQHAAGGEGDSRDAGSAAAKVMTMRMATTPTKGGGSGNSSGAREDVAASLLSMLRIETSKRKQAEARTAKLENAAADAAAAVAAAAASASVASPRQRQEGSTNASGDADATGDGYGVVYPCVRQAHGYGTGNAQLPPAGQASSPGVPASSIPAQQQPGADWFAHHAKADQEKQAAKITGLVRDARKKMATMSSSGGGGYSLLDTR